MDHGALCGERRQRVRLRLNPGGAVTEGYSYPLLFAVEAVSHLLGLSGVDTARVIGVLCGVGLLVLIHRTAPPVVGTKEARVALGLTALYPPLAIWAVGGLETLATALVITAGALLLAHPDLTRRRAVIAGGALALLPWLRPEGLVIALAIPGVRDGATARAPLAAPRGGVLPGLRRGNPAGPPGPSSPCWPASWSSPRAGAWGGRPPL